MVNMNSPTITTFDTAIGAIAWKHPNVAYAIRARARDARTDRQADRIRQEAISLAETLTADGGGGVIAWSREDHADDVADTPDER